jgi:hypothetical protein
MSREVLPCNSWIRIIIIRGCLLSTSKGDRLNSISNSRTVLSWPQGISLQANGLYLPRQKVESSTSLFTISNMTIHTLKSSPWAARISRWSMSIRKRVTNRALIRPPLLGLSWLWLRDDNHLTSLSFQMGQLGSSLTCLISMKKIFMRGSSSRAHWWSSWDTLRAALWEISRVIIPT